MRLQVVIAGMHRSGTSLVGSLLDAMGSSVGPESIQMAADADSNPHGHFELLPVVAINDRLLSSWGGNWAAPRDPSEEQLRELAHGPLGRRASEFLATEGADVEWIKDPRLCITFPFWEEVVGQQLSLIVPWRHPAEVASSIHRRNGLRESYGHAMHHDYNQSIRGYALHRPCHPLNFSKLRTEPLVEARRLRDFCVHHGLSFSESPEAASGLVEPTLPSSLRIGLDESNEAFAAYSVGMSSTQ